MTHPLTNALAMRTAAAKAIDTLPVFSVKDSDAVNARTAVLLGKAHEAILALPLEADRAALLHEALKLPEIAALVDFVNADRELRMIGILSATEDQMKILISARQKAHDALSALETP